MDKGGSTSLESLIDAIPKWLADLEELVECIERWRKEHLGATTTKFIQRSSSIDSVKPLVDRTTDRQRCSNVKNMTGRPNVGGAKTRKMIVLQYDAAIQKRMEELVRAVSLGRGYVRKGKMDSRISSLACIRIDSAGDSPVRPPTLREGTRSTRLHNELGKTKSGYSKALEQFDSLLTDVQMLCEHAAHEILRNGYCNDDIVAIRLCLQDLLRLCTTEQAKLKQEANMAVGYQSDEWEDEEEFCQVLEFSIASMGVDIQGGPEPSDARVPGTFATILPSMAAH